MESIIMTTKQLHSLVERSTILARLDAKQITATEASQQLQRTERQVWRLLAKYRKNGVNGLIHGNKLHPTNTGYDEDFKQQIISTYLGCYSDYNFSHYKDKLLEDYDLHISQNFISCTLTAAGIQSPRKHRAKHKAHPPRERRENAGELLQTDASKFKWLDGDDNYYELHGMIDDSSGIVTALWLEEQETNHGYQMCLMQTIQNYGIPACLYTDKRSTFHNNRKLTIEEELAGVGLNDTRFTKMLKRLGIDIISTSVPQAKGRIERLWNTLQDRLAKELRDAGIKTIGEANSFITNRFLPRYNERFASKIDYSKNYFIKVPQDYDCNKQLALIYTKRIYHGSYLVLNKQTYALTHNGIVQRLDKKLPVDIYQYLDGSLHIEHNGKWYDLMPIEHITSTSTHTKATRTQAEINQSKAHKPTENHPWRMFVINPKKR